MFDASGDLIIGPASWSGNFYCSSNQLTSLVGAPKIIGGNFYCYHNNLTSLKGAPEVVGGDFRCDCNNLTSLKGSPKIVGGNFYCYCNNLTSLVGAPKIIGGDFYCYHNNLTSLKGSPKIVGGSFYCYHNNLTSLKGATKIIGGDFYCSNNQLTSLDGSPTSDLKAVQEYFLNKGYLFVDRILKEIINHKKNIYKLKNIGSEKISYAITDGIHWSHGDTIKKASEDLKYKISGRDTSKYKNWNLDTVVTIDEAIRSYRTITGACELGTKEFVNSLGFMPEKLTVADIITLTKEKYGYYKFKEFFE